MAPMYVSSPVRTTTPRPSPLMTNEELKTMLRASVTMSERLSGLHVTASDSPAFARARDERAAVTG